MDRPVLFYYSCPLFYNSGKDLSLWWARGGGKYAMVECIIEFEYNTL